FTIRLNATATGTFGGVLSFSNTDANESPFNFNLIATVQPWIATLDNSAAGFATTGTWATGLEGLGGTCRYSSAVGSTATWTFTGLDAGQYRVYATWTPYANRPTAVPYAVTDGSTPLG